MALQYHAYKRYAVVVGSDGGPETSIEIAETYLNKPVTQIREAAFQGRTDIRAVVIHSSLTTVNSYAFEGCTNLRTITSRDNPTTLPFKNIGKKAFCNCVSLSGKLIFSNNDIEIEESSFEGTSLNQVSFAGSNVKLGPRAFKSSKLQMVSAENGLTSIPEECFQGCRHLHSVVLPNTRSVSSRAFQDCSLIAFPMRQLRKVSPDAFDGCPLLLPPGDQPEDRWRVETLIESLDELLAESAANEMPTLPEPCPSAACEEVLGMKPMMFLKLNDRSAIPANATRLSGFIHMTLEGVAFRVLQSSKPNIDALLEIPEKFRPLISKLREEKVTVSIVGKMNDEGIYKVYDMAIVPKADSPLTEAVFRQALLRIHDSSDHASAAATAPVREFIHGYEACKTYFKLVQNCLPTWVKVACEKEISQYDRLALGANEDRKHCVTALEHLLNVQWDSSTKMALPSLSQCRDILDRHFYALAGPKRVLMQELSIIHRTGHLPKKNLLFYGPPGSGKTQLAIQFLKEIIRRPVCRIDFSGGFSGNSAESLIGTSRIFQNARASLFMQEFTKHRTSDVAFLFNELDKCDAENSSVLLSLLDGSGVMDLFLETQVHIPNVFAVATSNTLDLPPALLSRFKIIHVPSYDHDELCGIFRHFALPRALDDAAFRPDQLKLMPDAEWLLIQEYIRDKDGRAVNQLAEDLVGKYALEIAEHPEGESRNRVLSCSDIRRMLGPGLRLEAEVNNQTGLARFSYLDKSGTARLGTLEAAVEEGSGDIQILGSRGNIEIRDAVLTACTALRGHINLDSKNITFLLSSDFNGDPTMLGLPAFIALLSCLRDDYIDWTTCTLLGSAISLRGGITLNQADMTTLIKHIPYGKRVYGPVGFSRNIDPKKIRNSPLLIEASTAMDLYSLLPLES